MFLWTAPALNKVCVPGIDQHHTGNLLRIGPRKQLDDGAPLQQCHYLKPFSPMIAKCWPLRDPTLPFAGRDPFKRRACQRNRAMLGGQHALGIEAGNVGQHIPEQVLQSYAGRHSMQTHGAHTAVGLTMATTAGYVRRYSGPRPPGTRRAPYGPRPAVPERAPWFRSLHNNHHKSSESFWLPCQSPLGLVNEESILERLRRRVVVLGCYMGQTPSGGTHRRIALLKSNESI